MLDKGVQEEEGELQGVSFASSPTLSSNTTARYFMVLIPSPGSTLISLLPTVCGQMAGACERHDKHHRMQNARTERRLT